MHRIWSISSLFYLVKNTISNVKNWQKSSKCLQSQARNISRDKRLDKGTRRRLSIGRESVANSNDAKVTSISRFKRRSIRKSRAWNFFFFSTIEIEFSEFSNRWRFDLFHDVSVRRNFAKLTIERDRFWLWREKIRAKRARDWSNVTIDAWY